MILKRSTNRLLWNSGLKNFSRFAEQTFNYENKINHSKCVPSIHEFAPRQCSNRSLYLSVKNLDDLELTHSHCCTGCRMSLNTPRFNVCSMLCCFHWDSVHVFLTDNAPNHLTCLRMQPQDNFICALTDWCVTSLQVNSGFW